MASRTVYQFQAELCDYTPKIWRRFQTAADISMAKLGYIVMTMFEMQASHLFHLDIPVMDNTVKEMLEHDLTGKLDLNEEDIKNTFEPKHRIWRAKIIDENLAGYDPKDRTIIDATGVKVKDTVFSPGNIMTFTYDYGDDWTISLVLEEVYKKSELPAKELPRVLEGEGYGIIEDCGGTFGLKELAAEFKKGRGPRYKELRDWLGTDKLDLRSFDIGEMNFRLKKVPRIYADIYEHKLEPTKRSWDILTRKYLE